MKKNLLIIKQSLKYLYKHNKLCLLCYFLRVILCSIEPLIYVLFSKYIIDSLFPKLLLKKAIILVIIMVSLQFLFSFLGRIISMKIENDAEKILYYQKMEFINHQKNIFYQQTENTSFYDDYYNANEYINRGSNIHIMNQLQIIFSSLLTIVGLIYLLKEVSIIALGLSLIIYFIKIKNKKIYEFEIKNTNSRRKENFYVWGFTNSKYIKENRLFETFPYISKEIDRASIELTKKCVQQFNLSSKYSIIPIILDGILIFIIYFSMVLSFKFRSLTVGDYSMILAAFISFSSTINAIIKASSAINNENFYFDKYNEILKSYELENNKEKIKINKVNSIEFKNVSFQYPNTEVYALKNINLKITGEDFKKISIVGKNGSGKSTFIKLLMKLYSPLEGDIYINDINIKDIPNEDYYSLFSPVFQDYKIYLTSIKNNISFDEDEIIDDELKQMDLYDKILELKYKEKTNISKEFDQEGIDFSGGERQKIAIARALHKKSCITILDEPTASLSSNSENQLYKMVLNCKDNIIFFISHRLSSCRFTDKIIVFDSGMIKEIGSHDELMNLNGIYTQLFLAQAELYRLGGEENEE